MKYLLFLFPIFLQAQCLIETHSYRLICADEVRYADSIASGSRLYISSRNAFVTSPRSVFSLVNGYGQHFIQITNSANSQKVAINRAWINRIDSTSGNKALIYIKDISVTFTTTESYTAVKDSAIACFIRSVASGIATLSDGDYGDVVVSGGGLVMTVDKPDLGLHNLEDGDFSVIADSTALSLTGTRSITLQTQNIDGWISRYLQTHNSLTLRTNNTTKTSRIFVDTTGANFQFVNGSNNASLRIGDSVAVRFNTSGSVGQVLTVTSIDGDGRLVINPKTGGSGTANCEQTITKASHGFSKWTPIYWNGSAWVRPTFDSIIPTYIVVDSTSVNTFKVSNCGNYSSTLTAGIYYYTGTSPGYTLTQPEIKVPLFEVAQARLILQPLVGFQLAGGSGGTADGNGIYSGSDSLSQDNTYAAMAADGSQNFALGYFPNFPDVDYDKEHGLYISKNYWDEVSLISSSAQNNTHVAVTSQVAALSSGKNTDGRRGLVNLVPGRVQLFAAGSALTDKKWDIQIDSSKFEITRNISGTDRTYQLLPPSQYPSATETNILKWTAGVPSFGYRYESDTIAADTYLKMPLSSGSTTYAVGYFQDLPDYEIGDFGLYVSPNYYREVRLLNGKSNNYNTLGVGSSSVSLFSGRGNYGLGANYSSLELSGGAMSLGIGNTSLADKGWVFYADSTQYRVTRNVGGSSFQYPLLPASGIPSTALNARTTLSYIGTSGSSTVSFLRSQHGVATGTTDGSGDLTVTFAAAMPDATYTMIATVEGTTSYTISVHTKATGTCKVRFFNPATGAAVTATSVTLSYEAKDY